MNFTSKTNIVGGLLVLAALGLITGFFGTSPFTTPQESVEPLSATPVVPAVELDRGTQDFYYQPVAHWYKNKHWWKRNLPIVGGAAGGALFGGLLGGGKGALIGGAVGGGGGYAYKRLSHRHHHQSRNAYQQSHPHNPPPRH